MSGEKGILFSKTQNPSLTHKKKATKREYEEEEREGSFIALFLQTFLARVGRRVMHNRNTSLKDKCRFFKDLQTPKTKLKLHDKKSHLDNN